MAAKAAAGAVRAVGETKKRLKNGADFLDGALPEPEVAATLAAIAAAEAAFRQARKEAEVRRAELDAAKGRRALGDEEKQAWGRLRASCAPVLVVTLGAPAVESTDLTGAWATLTAWAEEQHEAWAKRQPGPGLHAAALRQRAADDTAGLTRLLAEHGVTSVTEPARAAAAVATHRERAASELASVRQALAKAAKLDGELRAAREEEQVASMLGQMLQARQLEGWLCSEALDSLVAEASVTLRELSGGQYELGRDERNELIVIDYQDAGFRGPVHAFGGGRSGLAGPGPGPVPAGGRPVGRE